MKARLMMEDDFTQHRKRKTDAVVPQLKRPDKAKNIVELLAMPEAAEIDFEPPRFGEELMTGLDEVEAFLAGKGDGYKVHVPEKVDVKKIRKRLKMTQARFSTTFGFSLDAVKHWEGGRRTPESAARAFLTVIDRNPNAVLTALQPSPRARRKLARAS
jgi:putative transcriptional regulator